MHLTKRAIDGAKFEGKVRRRRGAKVYGRDIRWDELVAGFGLRIYPPNAEGVSRKSFVLNYRFKGIERMMVLGGYGVEFTLDQARKKAKKLLANLDTTDPLENKRKAAVKGETVADLCEAYLERYAKPHKKTWRKDQSRIERIILPKWGKRAADSLTRKDVASLHSRIGAKTPFEANRIREQLAKMFALGEDWGFLPKDHQNPATKIKDFKEHQRDRWLTHEELPRLAEAIDAEENPYVRACFWLLLHTGLRKNELLRAEWSHVNWERQELRIPETKSGRVHHVPLTPPALALLTDLQQVQGNPYIFVGHVIGKHLVNVDKAWRRIRKAAGVEDLRLHDLRRTVGSWLAQSGASLHLIGRVLNQSTQSATAIYARFGESHVREALDRHAAQVVAAAKGEPAVVVPIKGAEG